MACLIKDREATSSQWLRNIHGRSVETDDAKREKESVSSFQTSDRLVCPWSLQSDSTCCRGMKPLGWLVSRVDRLLMGLITSRSHLQSNTTCHNHDQLMNDECGPLEAEWLRSIKEKPYNRMAASLACFSSSVMSKRKLLTLEEENRKPPRDRDPASSLHGRVVECCS